MSQKTKTIQEYTRKPVVAHSVSPYMFPKGTWVYSQIKGLQCWQPLVITGHTENLDQFPFQSVYSISHQGRQVRAAERLRQRLHLPSGFHQQVCRQNEVQVIHSHFGWQGVHDIGLAAWLGVPQITAFYGTDLSLPNRTPHWHSKYDKLFAHCDLLLAEGTYSKQQLVDLGCPADKIRVQHLGIDLEKIPFIARRPDKGGTIRILIAGRFVEKKGIPYALRAFGKVAIAREDLKLRVELVGDAMDSPKDQAMKREINQVCSELCLHKWVNFRGFLPYDQLLKLAQSCHILVHPSVTASDGDTEGGAPLTIAEMSASGMPVLATSHCDIPQMVRDGTSGYLVPERDVEALADCLDFLISHPQTWPAMGQSGRKHIAAEYNVRHTIPKLEEIYESLVG